MARTIGKVKIKKLEELVYKYVEQRENSTSISWIETRARIWGAVPKFWLNTWESAWDEIHRIIEDEILNYIYKNKFDRV